jgi:tetratricopeptide (TPR) repeat protein
MIDQPYPGNGRLPEETKYRVENTFRQALSLYLDGKMEDCIVGCDFILKMDPQFAPARQLLDKARDPQAPVDLAPVIARYQAREALNVEECLIQAIELFNGREYARTVEVLSKVMAADPANAEARDILGRAQEKLEALPFVQQFVAKARKFMDEGDPDEARKQVLKGLALDEGNPELLTLQAELEGPAAGPPSFDTPAGTAEEPPAFEVPSSFDAAAPAAFEAAGEPGGGGMEFELPPDLPPVKPVVEAFAVPGEAGDVPPAEVATAEAPAPAFAFGAPAGEPEPFGAPAPPAPPAPAAEAASPFAFAEPVPAPEPPPAVPALPELEMPGAEAPARPASPQDEKIQALLADGDRVMMQNEYQEAIDIWSRIFLIDIHNQEASRKIEEAKRLLAEQDRKIEELFNLAVGLHNQGKKEDARAKFEEVLGMEPHHLAARNYLRQLDEEEGKGKPAQAMPEAPPPEIEEVLPPVPRVAVVRDEPKPKKKIWVPLAAVAGVLVLLAAGWWFLGGGAGMGTPPVNAAAAIAQAEQLYGQGKATEALALLAKVPPEDALYGRALELITAYKSGSRKKPVDTIDGRPADQVAMEWRETAYRAYQAKDYARAKEFYDKVAGIRPLSVEDKAFLEDVNRTLEAIVAGRSAFDTGNFDQAIATLQPIYDRDRVLQARDILVKAHYNRGIGALKDENLGQAEPDFLEILKLDETDQMAQKNLRLIQRYKDANKDLLFRTYVKYLKPR